MSLLAGMRVVEVSSFVAAPLGGTTLAQLGAEVIRVDPLGGAVDRDRRSLAASGTSLYRAGLTKGEAVGHGRIPLTGGAGTRRGTGRRSRVGCGYRGDQSGRQAVAQLRGLAAGRAGLINVGVQRHRDGTAAVDYTVNVETGFPLVTGPPLSVAEQARQRGRTGASARRTTDSVLSDLMGLSPGDRQLRDRAVVG